MERGLNVAKMQLAWMSAELTATKKNLEAMTHRIVRAKLVF